MGSGKRTILPALKHFCGSLVRENPDYIRCGADAVSYTTASFELGHIYRIDPTVWSNYLIDCFGFMFVVDSTDEASIEKNKRLLMRLIKDPKCEGKPFVIFANKQDMPSAMSPEEIQAALELNSVTTCPLRVLGSATPPRVLPPGEKMSSRERHANSDKRIGEGLVWMINMIREKYTKLKGKNLRDKQAQLVIDEILKELNKRAVKRNSAFRKELESEIIRLEAFFSRNDGIDVQRDLQEIASSDAWLRELPKRVKLLEAKEREKKDIMEQECQALLEELEQLQYQVNEISEDYKDLKTGDDAIRAAFHETKTNLATMVQLKEELNAANVQLESRRAGDQAPDDSKQQLEAALARIAELEEDLERTKDEADRRQQFIKTMESSFEVVQASLEEHQAHAKNHKKAAQAIRSSLQVIGIALWPEQIQNLEAEANPSEARSAKNAEKDVLENDNKSLAVKLSSLSANIDTADLDNLCNLLAKAEENLRREVVLRREATALPKPSTTTSSAKSEAKQPEDEAKAEETKADVHQLQMELSMARESLQQLNVLIFGPSTSPDIAQEELHSLIAAVEKLKEELDSAKAELSQTTAQLDEKSHEAAQHLVKVEAAAAEVATLTQEATRLRLSAEETALALSNADTEKVKQEQVIDELRSELKAKVDIAEELRQRLVVVEQECAEQAAALILQVQVQAQLQRERQGLIVDGAEEGQKEVQKNYQKELEAAMEGAKEREEVLTKGMHELREKVTALETELGAKVQRGLELQAELDRLTLENQTLARAMEKKEGKGQQQEKEKESESEAEEEKQVGQEKDEQKRAEEEQEQTGRDQQEAAETERVPNPESESESHGPDEAALELKPESEPSVAPGRPPGGSESESDPQEARHLEAALKASQEDVERLTAELGLVRSELESKQRQDSESEAEEKRARDERMAWASGQVKLQVQEARVTLRGMRESAVMSFQGLTGEVAVAMETVQAVGQAILEQQVVQKDKAKAEEAFALANLSKELDELKERCAVLAEMVRGKDEVVLRLEEELGLVRRSLAEREKAWVEVSEAIRGKEAELVTANDVLRARDAEAARWEVAAQRAETELNKLVGAMKERAGQGERLKVEIVAVRTELAAMVASLHEKESRLSSVVDELRGKELGLMKALQDLREKEGELWRVSQALKEREGELLHAREELKSREQTIDIAVKDLASKHETMREKDRELGTNVQELRMKESAAIEAGYRVRECEREIELARGQLEANQKTLTEMTESLKQREAWLAAKEQQLQDTTAALARSIQTLGDKEEAVRDVTILLRQKESELESREKYYRDMLELKQMEMIARDADRRTLEEERARMVSELQKAAARMGELEAEVQGLCVAVQGKGEEVRTLQSSLVALENQLVESRRMAREYELAAEQRQVEAVQNKAALREREEVLERTAAALKDKQLAVIEMLQQMSDREGMTAQIAISLEATKGALARAEETVRDLQVAIRDKENLIMEKDRMLLKVQTEHKETLGRLQQRDEQLARLWEEIRDSAEQKSMEKWVSTVAITAFSRENLEQQLKVLIEERNELKRELGTRETDVRLQHSKDLAKLREEYEVILAELRAQNKALHHSASDERKRLSQKLQELLLAQKRAAEERINIHERVQRGFLPLKMTKVEPVSRIGEQILSKLSSPASLIDKTFVQPAYEAALQMSSEVPASALSLIQEHVSYWAVHHGLAAANAEVTDPTTPPRAFSEAPVTLLPQPLPYESYVLAKLMTPELNIVLHRAAKDFEFMRTHLAGYAQVDPLVGGLFSIYQQVYASNDIRQPFSMAIHRYDFLTDTFHTTPMTRNFRTSSLYNTPMCLPGLVSMMHQYVVSKTNLEMYRNVIMPTNPILVNLPACLARACHLFEEDLGIVPPMVESKDAWGDDADVEEQSIKPKTSWNPTTILLMIVDARPHDEVDERWIEFLLWEQYRIQTVRRTLSTMDDVSLESKRGNLLVGGKTVAVTWFRSGHSIEDYPSSKEWNARLLIERSSCIKSPSVAFQLLNNRWMQFVLFTQAGILERFSLDPDRAKKIRKVVQRRYGLQPGHKNQAVIQTAIKNSSRYALTTYYEDEDASQLLGSKVVEALSNLPPEELAPFLLTERIQSSPSRAHVLRKGAVAPIDALFSFSMYGVFIGTENHVIINEPIGHVMQTHIEGPHRVLLRPYDILTSPFFAS